MFGVFKGILRESVPRRARRSADFFLPYLTLGLVESSSESNFLPSLCKGFGAGGAGGVGGGGAGGVIVGGFGRLKHIRIAFVV